MIINFFKLFTCSLCIGSMQNLNVCSLVILGVYIHVQLVWPKMKNGSRVPTAHSHQPGLDIRLVERYVGRTILLSCHDNGAIQHMCMHVCK